MARLAPGGPGNLLPVLLIGGALLYLLTRPRPAAAATGKAGGAPVTVYDTPTASGERIARAVNAITRGLLSAPPKTDTPAAFTSSVSEQLAREERVGLYRPNPFGGSIFGAVQPEAVPGASFAPPNLFGSPVPEVDGFLWAPVYEAWPTGNGE